GYALAEVPLPAQISKLLRASHIGGIREFGLTTRHVVERARPDRTEEVVPNEARQWPSLCSGGGEGLDPFLLEARGDLQQLIPRLGWLDVVLGKDLLVVPNPFDVQLKGKTEQFAQLDLLVDRHRRWREILERSKLLKGLLEVEHLAIVVQLGQ